MPKTSWSPHRQFSSRVARALPLGLVLAALASLFSLSPAAAILEEKLVLPLLFRARLRLHLGPQLDPRIKIFAFDDQTVMKFGLPSRVTSSDWLGMIQMLAARRPRAILVDFVWTAPALTDADRTQLRAMASGNVPVATGALASELAIPWLIPLPADAPALLPAGESDTGDGQQLYGPIRELAETSSYVGHLAIRDPGFFQPFMRGPNGARLPAMALRIPSRAPLPPTTSDGWAMINWIDPVSYAGRVHGLHELYEPFKSQHAVDSVGPDDTVLVLSEMFTGSSDHHHSALGRLAGGHAQVAIANGALTGDWLKQLNPGLLGPLIGVSAAIAVASAFEFGIAVAAMLIIGLCFATAVLTLFAGQDVVMTCMPTSLAFIATGIAVMTQRKQHENVLLAQIDQALAGVIAPAVLERIRRDPAAFRVVASDQMLTALFVDFVGFSTIAERLEPEAMFNSLEEVLTSLASIVHAHGGVIDKTVGDGLIAFFGYEPVTGGIDADHADHALHCAVAIQRHLAAFASARMGTGLPTFPARIGLNSGRAHVGNLGGGRRFDVTIIGHTVNMAKRFEDSCETFRVLLGPNTYILLSSAAKSQGFDVRKAKLKHRKAFLNAYECDPFAGDGAILRDALDAHRLFVGLERGTERYVLPAGTRAYVISDDARAGEMIDYSTTGMQIRLDLVYYANRVRISFALDVEHADGRSERIDGCQATIKWGRKCDAGYLHGIEIEDPNPNLRRILREFAEKFDAA